ncbi:MAG: hypothetical protein GY715_04785 [Planctomycetes bacterium]|nr:hypothetical protein [Planctomycetota bacterium]
MKKTLIACVVLASVAVLLAATPQSDPLEDEIDKMRVEMANLQLRVSDLEHAAGVRPASGVSASGGQSEPASAAPARTMVLVSINQSHHGEDHAEEISRLKRECASLMNTVNAKAEDKANDLAQPVYAAHVRGGIRGWGRHVGGGYTSTNAGSIVRQHNADSQIESRYATLHAIKKRKLEDLQNADARPRQIIMGHDGNTIISLETKTDLERSLEDVQIGDLVTWAGRRVSADDDSESWLIDSVHKAPE